MNIPRADEGYAVDPTGMVHRRYAVHARGLPRSRTLDGALGHVRGKAIPCPECWPQVVKPKSRAKGGPVHRATATIVGERGPETVVPTVSGRVYPAVEDADDSETEPG